MAMPAAPPLNGRNIAEFYTASEATKRSKLKAYARPPEEQQARIIMYDSVRRALPEYFGGGRSGAVLDRVGMMLENRQFKNAEFDETWHKSNRAALQHLRELDIGGAFEDVRSARAHVSVANLRINSTADFYATLVPTARNAKAKRVAVIINPSGIKVSSAEKRKTWAAIESEIAWRCAADESVDIEEVLYIDLPKHQIHRHKGPKVRVWDEIDATCERIVRDWREIRLDESRRREDTA
jgi:hypothetical protein